MRRLIVAAAVGALTTAGCASEPPSSAPADPPEVAWSDVVCGSVLTFATAVTTAPDFAAAGDLGTVQRVYSTYLGEVVGALTRGRSALDAAGRAPVAAGDAAARRVRDGLVRLEQDFTGARATVDAAEPRVAREFVASVRQVESTLRSVAVPDVVGELQEVPGLASAADRAPRCARIATMAAAPR